MSIDTEIITIGDELLIGQTIDTNSAWLGQELNANGYPVVQITSISDDPLIIKEALDLALPRAKLIVLTGGLGPTRDDKTKSALAEYFNSSLVRNEEVVDHIRLLLGSRKVPLNDLNLDQANLPEGCIVLRNDSGTAPGMLFVKDDHIIVSLPGVPYEMKSITTKELLPWLKENLKTTRTFFRMAMTTGYAESVLAAKLENWESSLPSHCSLAYLPSPGTVKLRVSAKGKPYEELQKDVDTLINSLKLIIPEAIFSLKNESIEQTVGKILAKWNRSVGTAESCTGGTIAQLFTSVPGSSRYFKGAVVCYSNDVKMQLMGVSKENLINHGAVSEEVVSEMASNARKILQVDYAIASSGIAGPDGGTEDKPVGLVWLSVASASKTISRSFEFGNHRGRNIMRSSIAGINMLRLLLEDEFH